MDAIDAIAETFEEHYEDEDVELVIEDMMVVVAVSDGEKTNVLFHAQDARRYIQIGLLEAALMTARYG